MSSTQVIQLLIRLQGIIESCTFNCSPITIVPNVIVVVVDAAFVFGVMPTMASSGRRHCLAVSGQGGEGEGRAAKKALLHKNEQQPFYCRTMNKQCSSFWPFFGFALLLLLLLSSTTAFNEAVALLCSIVLGQP